MTARPANEYEHGFEEMALHFGMHKRRYGTGFQYRLPDEAGEGWIVQMPAAGGLSCTSVWFTSKRPLTYTFRVDKPCMWMFNVSAGDIVFSRKGTAAPLKPMNQIVVNPQKPLTVTFPANELICYTCVWMFEDYIQQLLGGKLEGGALRLSHVATWAEQDYNTPDLALVMDEIKWAVRKAVLPMFYYECKAGELLMMIYRNINFQWIVNRKRAYHVTWENQQLVRDVKKQLDYDILNAPSLSELAAAATMSVSKFSRCFLNLYGMTVAHYIQTEKMKKAMQMLARDELAIKDIAKACGYKCASRFTEAFKATNRITPREYRKAFYL
ncbi:AraC family transcriptional regulator [Paenibacillus sp. GYB004]|uniref:helix-turn-helix transcriptional regulator n=1 Tax=Paenibacillus sp. GYB004 TaxID=2994393 RepID=UPI002F9670A3